MTVLGSAAPVGGGRDLHLPGDGIRLAATRWPGVGPPVLLLHGLASQRRFWNLVVPGLAGLPLVAIDQRGHGDSDRPDDGYDTATLVRDAATALDALGLSRVVVVGHSWGAVVALSFAGAHPERTLAVVGIDGGLASFAGRWSSREEAREALAPPEIAMPVHELTAMIRQGSLGPWWSAAVEDAVLPIFAVGVDGLARSRLDRAHHLAIVDALWNYDPADVLPRVAAPCWLVIAATGDDAWTATKREGLDRAGNLLPQPRLLTLGGAVHDVPLQWPALVAGIVRAAADEVSAGMASPTSGGAR